MMALVLDPCCGSKMFWFNKSHPEAVYGDIRSESHVLCDGRSLNIAPDQRMDFTALPFPDGSFKLVVFDPPHLEKVGDKGWQFLKYGRLSGQWRADLKAGFSECFRVLANEGVLIFKWNETQIKVSEILALCDHSPLFGHPSGKKGGTHWITFMKLVAANDNEDTTK